MVQVEIYKGFEMSVVYPPTSLLEQRRCILDNIDPVRSNGQNRKIKIQTVTKPQDTEAPQVSPIKNTDNSLALLQDNSNKNGKSQCDSSSRSNNKDIMHLITS